MLALHSYATLFMYARPLSEDDHVPKHQDVDNFDPPATEEEIYLSSLQFVRKLSGTTRPSKANQVAFDRAVDKVSRAARELIDSLVTTAPPRDREAEALKARARSDERFGTPSRQIA